MHNVVFILYCTTVESSKRFGKHAMQRPRKMLEVLLVFFSMQIHGYMDMLL